MLSSVFCRSMKPLIAVNCTKSRKNVTTMAIWSQPWHRKLKILSPRTDHDTCSLTTFRVYFSSKITKENYKNRTKKKNLCLQNFGLSKLRPRRESPILDLKFIKKEPRLIFAAFCAVAPSKSRFNFGVIPYF